MPARYMLDTDICIYIRKRRPSGVHARFSTLSAGDAVISAITHGELHFGAVNGPHRDRDLALLEAFVGAIPVQPVSQAAAVEYGEIRLELSRRGELIGANDLWIAAHARAAGLTLITNNEREFRRVPGLAVENWVAGASE